MKKYFLTLLLAVFLLLPILVKAAPKETIDEIVVSARLNPKPLSHINNAVSILTSEELSRQGQLFLIDALRFQPGITITQEGGAGALASVRIRGGESSHTKTFIDGVEVNNVSSGGFDFGSLLVGQIERVEIVRGANSLVNGAGAVGGVVYITTKKNSGADFQLSVGSFGTFNLVGNIGANKNGFNWNLGGQLYRTDGNDVSTLDTLTTDRDRRYDEFSDDKESYFNATFNTKLGYQKNIGTHQIKTQFSYRHVSSKLEGDQGLDVDPDPSSFLFLFLDTGQNTQSSNHQVNVLLSDEVSLTPNLELFTSVSGQYFDLSQTAISVKETLSDPNNPSSAILYQYRNDLSKEERTTANAKISVFYEQSLFKLDLTSFGGWEIEKYFRPLSHSSGAVDEFETKRYIASEISASGYGADITAGVRGQFYSNSQDALIWQMGAGFVPPFQKLVRVRGSYGTSINEPTLIQLYGFFPPSFTPNPNLKSEKITSWDGGFDVDLSILTKSFLVPELKFSASGFALYIEDEITGFSTPINGSGISKRRGSEFEVQLSFAKFGVIERLGIAASYTYTEAKKSDGSKSLNRPKHVANLTMRTRIKALTFDWDLSWQSNQLAYNGRIKSYPLINVQLGLDLNDKLNVFVRGENLTNERTANAVSYERRGVGVYFGIKGKI